MNKKLEDFFGMEPSKTSLTSKESPSGITIHSDGEQTIELQPIDLDKFDQEMDDIAASALKSFEEIMTRSELVEDKDSGKLYSAASDMIKNALTAKNQKMKARLDCYDLYSRHMTRKATSSEQPDSIANNMIEGKRVSRSEILKRNNNDQKLIEE